MTGGQVGRDALERQEQDLVEEVATLVRREQALAQEAQRVVMEKTKAVGGLVAIRKALGKPPTGEAVIGGEVAAPQASRPPAAKRRARPKSKAKRRA